MISSSSGVAAIGSVIEANEEWQHFASGVLTYDINLPPNGQAEVLLQPQQLGVFPISQPPSHSGERPKKHHHRSTSEH